MLLRKGTRTCYGEGVRNPGQGEKYSEPSARPQGGSKDFQLGVTANQKFKSQPWESLRCCMPAVIRFDQGCTEMVVSDHSLRKSFVRSILISFD